MKSNVINKFLLLKFLLLSAVLLFVSAASLAQESKKMQRSLSDEQLLKMDKDKFHPPSGATFNLSLATGNQFYTALLAEGSKFVQEYYTHNQIPLLKAIVDAANAFSLTEENVGVVKPQTTRFSDEQLPSFIVDVAKSGKQSHFYITMKNRNAILTIDAGTIRRDKPKDRDVNALFLTIVEQLKNINGQVPDTGSNGDNPAQVQTRPPQ